MWIDFFVASLFILAILYVPGYLFSRVLQIGSIGSLLCAPLPSLAGYVLLGIVYDFAELSMPWYGVVAPVFLVGLTLFVVFRKRWVKPEKNAAGRFQWLCLALYVLVGIAIMTFYYVRCLGDPNSFAQIFDNGAHLNQIRSYAESGFYSVFHSSVYLDGTTSGCAPVDDTGLSFYPAAWHVVGALSCNALSVPAAIAENAANYVFAGIVFPSAVYLLMSFVFEGDKKAIVCGAFCCLAFESFPWGMMLFGPLYSNMMSFCILPLVLFCLASLTRFRKGEICRYSIMFVVGGFVLAASQPNAIFTAIVLFLPYCATRIYRYVVDSSKGRKKAVAFAGGFVILVLALWVALWASPAFSAVVTYSWPSFTGKVQAVVNVLTLSLRDSPAQIVLSFFVLFGVAYSLYAKRMRWLIWSYVAAAAIYCVAASTDGVLKTLLSGFWYNDSYRLASMLALASIPLAALGMSSAIKLLQRIAGHLRPKEARRNMVFSALAVILPFLLLVFAPTHSLNGLVNVETAFSRVAGGLSWLADPANRKYTIEESEFVEQAQEIVSQDPGVIVNLPFDGSVFAYGADGLDIYYRTFYSYYGESETSDSALIRLSLANIKDDRTIQEAVSRVGAKYVLLLDAGMSGESVHADLFGEEDEEKWRGVIQITDGTPGFETVLSEGDMRLYRIVA